MSRPSLEGKGVETFLWMWASGFVLESRPSLEGKGVETIKAVQASTNPSRHDLH